MPKTNTDFWNKKIRRNKERDNEVKEKLAAMGWHSITIWECELKKTLRKKTLESLEYTLNRIFLNDNTIHYNDYLFDEEPMIAAEDIPTNYQYGSPEKDNKNC